MVRHTAVPIVAFALYACACNRPQEPIASIAESTPHFYNTMKGARYDPIALGCQAMPKGA